MYLALLLAVKSVTLDVKDEEVHAILRSVQKQCAVRNLVIDPGVEGRGTFTFHNLPCDKAFEVVTSTMGLEAREEGSSVVTVRRRQSR
jgi:hypothetical protein